MNTTENQIFEVGKGSAPFRQDKYSASRCRTASQQPYSKRATALQNQKTDQSTDGCQKFYAGSWVDRATDTYIDHRVKEGRRKDHDYSRSKAIRDIIRERAQDESFQASQAVLLPMIQETMQTEHRRFESRYLALTARMVYQNHVDVAPAY